MSVGLRSSGVAVAVRTALALLLPATLLLWSGAGSAAEGPRPRAAAQQARVVVLPQVVQQGRWAADADAAKAAITATVTPLRVGRPVRLQVLRDYAWHTVATVRTDERGRAELAAAATVDGQPATYRVRAQAFRGLARVTSDPVTTERWLEPTWTDEFSGSALSPDWNHRGQTYERESLRRCSKGDPRAVRVSGGTVRLSVLADPDELSECPTRVRGKVVGSYAHRLNGHIGTQGAFSFRYGVAAARVKFHRLRGQHGSFWLQPVGGMHPGSPGHEIDVIEYFGDNHPRGGLTTFIHRYEGSRVVRTGARVTDHASFLNGRRDGWSKGFHVFSVEWTPRRLVFRIDGKEAWRTSGGISSAPQFPILSLLASDYEIPKMKDHQLPQHMYVDWVRVWETRP